MSQLNKIPPGSAAEQLADNPWWAVWTVSLGAFAMVTSEFLPIGMLSAIAGGIHVPLSEAGWLVTVPGVLAALAAPASALVAQRVERRKLLMALALLVCLSNLVAFAAPNFETLLLGRAFLGMSVGMFWTYAPAVGRRLVTASEGNRATALIMGGISAGTILGVPAGAVLGEAVGWRAAFAVLSVMAFCVCLAQLRFLPALLPAGHAVRTSLLGVLRIKPLRVGLLAAALMVIGHFAGFTYLQPLLSSAMGESRGTEQLALFLFGVAGLLGTVAADRIATAHTGLAFGATAALAGCALLLLGTSAAGLAGQGLPGAAWLVLVCAWGAAFGALPVCLQIWLFKAAPAQLEASSALTVVVFQAALALGAVVGSEAMKLGGLDITFWSAGGMCLLSAVTLLSHLKSRPLSFS